MLNRKAFSLSPSALNAYEWCPAQYLASYIMKIPGTEFVVTADIAIGKAAHRVMKKINERRRDGKPTTPADVDTWASDYWDEEKLTIANWQDMSDDGGREWVQHHSRELAAITRGRIPAQIESYGSLPLLPDDKGAPLFYMGGIQDATHSTPVVDDYKTSSTKAFTAQDREKYRVQAAVYAAIYRHEHGVLPEVNLITSDTAGCAIYTVPLSNTSVDDVIEQAERAGKEIIRLLDTGTPFPRGRSCRFCPLQGECPQTFAPVAAA